LWISYTFYTVGFYTVNFYTGQLLYGQNLYGWILYGQNLYSSKFIRFKIYTGQNLYRSKFIQVKIYTVQNLYSQFLYSTNFIQAPNHPLLSSMHKMKFYSIRGKMAAMRPPLRLKHRKRVYFYSGNNILFLLLTSQQNHCTGQTLDSTNIFSRNNLPNSTYIPNLPKLT
jgi:hypothetical protein